MSRPVAVARYVPSSDGGAVCCPAPGMWSDPPRDGAWLGPGAGIGKLWVLNRALDLVLPAEAAGCVVRPGPDRKIVAVEFDETLFLLSPLEGADRARQPSGRPRTTAHGEELPAGSHAVVAPSDGVFYARPSPEDPPFVEAGKQLRRGEAIGLVEVMKTFNQILYGGLGLPEKAEVVEIRCADGQEVTSGQVLIVVREV